VPTQEADEAGGISLREAVEAAHRADPGDDGLPPEFIVRFLRRLPRSAIFAAVDDRGVIRATAASATFGSEAIVVFVSTDVSYRGRGIATSMTAHALLAARAAGASRACLDASAAGESIYLRLGFHRVGEILRYAPRPA
jgi:predicted GNAT family acetyltransferase